MKKVLVNGCVAIDIFLSHEGSFIDFLGGDLQNLAVCYQTPHLTRRIGGNGANVAWTLKLLGQEPLLIATVGKDGDECLDLLKSRSIDTSHIRKLDDCVTATSFIGTDTHDHQITFFHVGADARRTWDDEKLDAAYAIVPPTDAPIAIAMLRSCKERGIPCVLDIGPRLLRYSVEDLWEAVRLSAGVMLNAYEAELLTTRLETTEHKIAKEAGFFVVTRDANGFLIHTADHVIGYPRCDADNVVNPTGAGDAFRAGFITGMMHGWTMDQAGQLGASAASFVVEQQGTLLMETTKEQVWARAEKTYGQPLPRL